jgi:hypothetical protein
MSENENNKYINMDKFNPDDHMKTENPLIYHVYNNKKLKACKTVFHSFIKFIMYLL